MSQTLRQYVTRRFSDLSSERSSWISHWKDLARYIEPRIGRFLTNKANKGSKKNGFIINSTGTFSLRVLTSGLMTGLTSPARPWFKIGLADTFLNDSKQNKLWLGEIERILLSIFRKSNVYQSLISIYEELGLIGTGCMMVEQNDETVINTKIFTAGEYYFGLGSDGQVNAMYREFQKTIGQLVEEYGLDNVSANTKNQYENDRLDKYVDVRHGIEVNRRRQNGSFLAKDKKWASYHWEVSANENDSNEGFLRRSGFDEFPVMAPRWFVNTSDVYGRSPSMDILGDVKQLQTQERVKAKAQAKLVDPPMNGDGNLHSSQVNTSPGGFTSVVNVAGNKSFEPAYQIKPELAAFTTEIEKVENRIRKGLFEDLFLSISNLENVRSATEIVERKEEKLLMLGPVIERVEVELLDNLITRTFSIADRMGLIPPAPDGLEGAELNIEYISPLAQAQKAVATGVIERLGAYVGSAAELNPNALDKFNVDKSIDLYADALGAPADLTVSEDEVEELRAIRSDQARIQRQAEAQPQFVESAKTLSEIDPAGNDIVNQILGSATGQ